MGSVYVIGSINMDVVALAERHPRHGETVRGSDLKFLPGGKGANQAVAARRAGANTYMVGTVGEDAFASELRSFLEEEMLGLEFVGVTHAAPTGTALITVANAENTIVVVPGANDLLSTQNVSALPFESGDVVVAQFEIRQETVLAAFNRARRMGALTVLNPAPAATPLPGLLTVTDVLIVNESELGWLVGDRKITQMKPDQAVAAARAARGRSDQVVVVTLGANGAVAIVGDDVIRVEGHRVAAVDTTGAGDCFVGNMAAALSRDTEFTAALRQANHAASLCVQALGASGSMPRLGNEEQARRVA
jgi:ribokinase